MSDLIRQYEYNTNKGPYYKSEAALPSASTSPSPVHLLAFVLPQFHSIAENDEWWGPGFTEWTNTTKALPRFHGHYQPRLPADLGFYDMSKPETLRRQVALAKRGGIHGFCFHNYWFGGRKLLQRPLENLLADPTIDMPFCVNWANESWSRRWDGSENEVMLQQTYSEADADGYADYLLELSRDPRYIRVDGRPLVLVYRPDAMPDAAWLIARWRKRMSEAGAPNPYVVMVRAFRSDDPRPFGADAAVMFPPHRPGQAFPSEKRWHRLLDPDYRGYVSSYMRLARDALAQSGDGYRLFPGVMPGWDNEARKPGRGSAVHGSTPGRYGWWLYEACKQALAAPSPDERIVFINAWNEWAEGAYLEPDRHYGYAYLAETRRVIDALASGQAFQPTPDVPGDPLAEAGSRPANFARNLPILLRQRLRGRS